MSNEASEREALLEERVRELEAAASLVRRAGPFEQGWALLRHLFPVWLIALGAGMFIAFHAWSFFIQAQVSEAETELKKAQAAVQEAEQRAQTSPTNNGEEIRVATA